MQWAQQILHRPTIIAQYFFQMRFMCLSIFRLYFAEIKNILFTIFEYNGYLFYYSYNCK